ncbi:MAG: hypothetical protein U9N38_03740 [Thermodesulfobacteriota bacterium]|nr:hypothetical protein [Thermodesulfobacteriota bacterium]
MECLLIVDYRSDAERKRIDYAIERWGDKAEIKKPRGATILFKGSNIDEFTEDLYSRLDIEEDRVEIYGIERYSPDIEKQVKKLIYESGEESGVIEKFIIYIMNKINASYEYSTDITKCYTAYTKKGQANIEILLKRNELTRAVISVSGYGDAVDFVADRIDDEMKVFLGGL